MRTPGRAAAYCLVATSVLCLGCANPGVDIETSADEVRAAYEQYRLAAEAEDAATIVAMFSTRAEPRVFFSDGAPLLGTQAIEAGYRAWFAAADSIRLAPKEVQVQVSPQADAAWMTYLEDGSVLADGTRQAWSGLRATLVFSRETDGWRIVHGHWSNLPAAAPSPVP